MNVELQNTFSAVDYDWRTLSELGVKEKHLNELMEMQLVERRMEDEGYSYRRITNRWGC